jgi:hypothetical protein
MKDVKIQSSVSAREDQSSTKSTSELCTHDEGFLRPNAYQADVTTGGGAAQTKTESSAV